MVAMQYILSLITIPITGKRLVSIKDVNLKRNTPQNNNKRERYL